MPATPAAGPGCAGLPAQAPTSSLPGFEGPPRRLGVRRPAWVVRTEPNRSSYSGEVESSAQGSAQTASSTTRKTGPTVPVSATPISTAPPSVHTRRAHISPAASAPTTTATRATSSASRVPPTAPSSATARATSPASRAPPKAPSSATTRIHASTTTRAPTSPVARVPSSTRAPPGSAVTRSTATTTIPITRSRVAATRQAKTTRSRPFSAPGAANDLGPSKRLIKPTIRMRDYLIATSAKWE
ncbi:integumentary mucin C.1-like isoform X1 [Triticum dicoccoides]|uniref:integumentary mucin C.1-like isoform X1 n=1 Tax=Triticum dicoccoides TaxID=85692 RepID=UPI00188FC109|nr:integumentary mucin C.1-like isoform X1 [Triticum dicoccoides]